MLIELGRDVFEAFGGRIDDIIRYFTGAQQVQIMGNPVLSTYLVFKPDGNCHVRVHLYETGDERIAALVSGADESHVFDLRRAVAYRNDQLLLMVGDQDQDFETWLRMSMPLGYSENLYPTESDCLQIWNIRGERCGEVRELLVGEMRILEFMLSPTMAGRQLAKDLKAKSMSA